MKKKEMPKIRIGFQLIICLSFAIVLIINGLLVGNYWGKVQNWLNLTFKAQKAPYFSFVFFGAAGILLIIMVAAIIDARRQAECRAEEERARALEEKQHAEEIEKQKNEIEKLNEELELKNQQLINKDEENIEEVQMILHDLKHQLANIFGNVEAILGWLDDECIIANPDLGKLENADISGVDEMKKEFTFAAKTIKRGYRRIITMLQGQIDHMQAEINQPITLTYKIFDLIDLIEEVAENKKKSLEEKHNQLIIAITDTLEGIAKIEADEIRTSNILYNLVDNANKYTSGGSIAISLDKDNENFILKVKDNGIGIKKEFQEKIFERGFIIESEEAKETAGNKKRLGLGLASAAMLAKQHGGSLKVESDGLGHGSTFILTIPIKPIKPTK